jgi:phosphohistidine phosphatase
MKTLFLIRHAKSSWDDTALPDKDRPLDDRGKRDAPKVGKRLAKRDVKPDLILSSPARRALTTAQIIAKKHEGTESFPGHVLRLHQQPYRIRDG